MESFYYYLDGDGCVLCDECAEESREDFVEHFRPVSGPHLNTSECHCDECSREIPYEGADEEGHPWGYDDERDGNFYSEGRW